MRRFQAVFFAERFGIDRLTAFDTHEHPLQTLLGRDYQSSTLSQFLGQLERVGADEALMPTLIPEQVGQIIYVDGHMIASWSRRSMHKGKITMLGRIMAGPPAPLAPDDTRPHRLGEHRLASPPHHQPETTNPQPPPPPIHPRPLPLFHK